MRCCPQVGPPYTDYSPRASPCFHGSDADSKKPAMGAGYLVEMIDFYLVAGTGNHRELSPVFC